MGCMGTGDDMSPGAKCMLVIAGELVMVTSFILPTPLKGFEWEQQSICSL